MRNILHNALEALIWVVTGLMILGACVGGGVFLQVSGGFGSPSITLILVGFLIIVFGVTMSFVFAGVCFAIMDIRRFTKHAALSLQKQR